MPTHLTIAERDRLAQLRTEGYNQKEIAEQLKRSSSTISRELGRNCTGDVYYAGQAQQCAQQRRSERPLETKLDDPQLNEFVRQGLAQAWSPEQIAQRWKLEPGVAEAGRCVSAPTIYAWIEHDPERDHWKSFLRRRGKRPSRRKPPETACASRIANRPEVIENRVRLGDFEGDTVLGPPGTGGLVTLVDRKSRFTIITKINSKDADHVHERIMLRLKELLEEQRHSITFDNGTEFTSCGRLTKHLGLALYYADPGCPYQRGTNENTNGLIRQFFPKGTKFETISHADVRHAENLLNNRPRKCLQWRTPHEAFHTKPAADDCV